MAYLNGIVSSPLSLSGGTVTTSNPVLNLTQTWNNAAVTFTGYKLNVTDTASNASSLLADLQVGGVSKFKVGKDGYIYTFNGWKIGGDSSLIFGYGGVNQFASGGTPGFRVNASNAGQGVGFVNGDAYGSPDLWLTRKGAANLRLGQTDVAAPIAQTLSVQGVVAGTTNTSGANLTITGSQGTGTGVGGSIVFQVAPAGSTGTAQNALVNALTIDSTKLATFTGSVNGTQNIIGFAAQDFVVSSYLFVRQNIFALGGPTNSTDFLMETAVQNVGIMNAGMAFGWGSQGVGSSNGVGLRSSFDLKLFRDAANILAQRNGVNAQTTKIYGTYTDASNYERLSLSANSTAAYITAENAGTGTARPLYLGTNSTTSVIIDTVGNVTFGNTTVNTVFSSTTISLINISLVGF